MKMSGKTIPEQIKNQVDEIVKSFNKKVIKDPNCYYVTRYKGNYLYLDRLDYSSKISVCRLQYTGDINKWEFAIFKYSDGRYDPNEWFFPGSGHIDGTVEGAMKAGLEAYP
jgi:hypothetical protein